MKIKGLAQILFSFWGKEDECTGYDSKGRLSVNSTAAIEVAAFFLHHTFETYI